MKSFFTGARGWFAVALVVGVVLGIAASWTNAKTNTAKVTSSQTDNSAVNPDWARAILTVSNLSCGGCIENITASLAPLPGIGKISVDIATGAADVYFYPNQLTDPQKIVTAITTAGYPAKIERIVAAEQVQAELAQFARRAEVHIASVGQLEISRQDYAIELSHARARYQSIYGDNVFSDTRGEQVLDRIKAQIASRLVSDGIKLQEVKRAGYQLSSQRVAKALKDYLTQRRLTLDQFKTDLENSNYPFDYFQKKFAQRVLVQSYIDERVLVDSTDPDDRQQRYANWLSNAIALSKVVYYDKSIEDLTKSGNSAGCGGSSCSIASK